MAAHIVEIAQRGQITIPKTVRDKHNIQEGQKYAVHDLGEGVLLLSPHQPRLVAMCNELRDTLLDRGASLEAMLAELRRMRENENA